MDKKEGYFQPGDKVGTALQVLVEMNWPVFSLRTTTKAASYPLHHEWPSFLEYPESFSVTPTPMKHGNFALLHVLPGQLCPMGRCLPSALL